MEIKYWVKKFIRGVRFEGLCPTLNKTFSIISGFPLGVNLFETVKIAATLLVYRHKKMPFGGEASGVIVVGIGSLGDSVLSVQALVQLSEYCKGNNKALTVICSEKSKKIFEKYTSVKDVYYLAYKEPLDYSGFMFIIRRIIAKRYDCAIKATSVSSSDLLAFVKAEKFLPDDINIVPEQDRSIFCKKYFYPQICKQVLLELGVPDYSTKQIVLKKDSSQAGTPCIIICPEAANRARCIEVGTFKQIVLYVRKHSDLKLIVSMTKSKIEYHKEINQIVGEIDDVELSDDMSFDDFTSLIQNASCVIGCDSGSVHFAAAFGIPTLVLSGQHNKGVFFPYSYDIKAECEPICVFCEDLDCSLCSIKKKYQKNPKCRKLVENGLSEYCMSHIQIDKIYSAIDRLLIEAE